MNRSNFLVNEYINSFVKFNGCSFSSFALLVGRAFGVMKLRGGPEKLPFAVQSPGPVVRERPNRTDLVETGQL